MLSLDAERPPCSCTFQDHTVLSYFSKHSLGGIKMFVCMRGEFANVYNSLITQQAGEIILNQILPC
jgi:hypothetical protein